MKPIVILCALAALPAFAQHPKGSFLVINVENQTLYIRDTADPSRLATDANPTTGTLGRNFNQLVDIGDIVAVNGTPVKGTVIETIANVALTPNPTPGQAIADTIRNGLYSWNFEIMGLDGHPIGSILVMGTGQGPPPPGATKQILAANHVVIGGTGAFLGVRGYMGAPTAVAVPGGAPAGIRQASITEDPSKRRINGSGPLRQGIYLLPMFSPEIVTTTDGVAVYHSDFSPVNVAKPAKAGEVLVLKMTGIGPTRPGVEPGEPFPLDSIQEANSPVDAAVNGSAVDVVNKIGWPGLVDTYRVDIRVPEGTPAGMASIQVTAAWISGPEFKIPIR